MYRKCIAIENMIQILWLNKLKSTRLPYTSTDVTCFNRLNNVSHSLFNRSSGFLDMRSVLYLEFLVLNYLLLFLYFIRVNLGIMNILIAKN